MEEIKINSECLRLGYVRLCHPIRFDIDVFIVVMTLFCQTWGLKLQSCTLRCVWTSGFGDTDTKSTHLLCAHSPNY